MNARLLLPLLLACGCAEHRAKPPELRSTAVDTVVVDRAFTDSLFQVFIRGNDGAEPGDALFVGQASRLIGSAFAVERRADGRRGVSAREASGIRLRWRSLTPDVVAVDSVGRVRALRPGAGLVEAAAFLAGAGSSAAPVALDTMPFRVLAPDPARVGPRFTEVSATHTSDAYETCGITTGGEVACLPSPAIVEAPGGGDRGIRVLPRPEETRFHGVATGFGFVCALDAEGRAFCWGNNEWGQLGRRGDGADGAARPAATAARFTRLSAGRDHACGVTTKRVVLCWGLDSNGSLGPAAVDRCTVWFQPRPHRSTRAPAACARTPRRVPLPGPALDVAAGDDHTCALTVKGGLHCWGQVHDIRFRSRTPRRIDIEPAGVRLERIASGSAHLCGLDGGGTMYCWGRNWAGQLGAAVGQEGSRRLAPVPGVPPLRALTAGAEHTCGIARSADAFCWGNNFNGQLGGGTWKVNEPARVAGGLAWSAIAAGHSHSCGVVSTGALYCWGSGLAFRWEPGSYHEQPEPFAVSGWR
jgi:hypothetical protein